MELIPDWANAKVRDRGSGAVELELHVEGLGGVDHRSRARYFDLGFETTPLDSSGRSLWDDLVVNFDAGTVTMVVPSTGHGSEIREAFDVRLAEVAREIDRLEQAEREEERVKEREAREREDQLARFREDLGG